MTAITPYLEPAAKELAEATDPHPRIYEVPPEQGRDILLGLQNDPGVPRPDVDEEWVEVDAGQWGTVRTRPRSGWRARFTTSCWTPAPPTSPANSPSTP